MNDLVFRVCLFFLQTSRSSLFLFFLVLFHKNTCPRCSSRHNKYIVRLLPGSFISHKFLSSLPRKYLFFNSLLYMCKSSYSFLYYMYLYHINIGHYPTYFPLAFMLWIFFNSLHTYIMYGYFLIFTSNLLSSLQLQTFNTPFPAFPR